MADQTRFTLVDRLASEAYGYATELDRATRDAYPDELEEVARRVTNKFKAMILRTLVRDLGAMQAEIAGQEAANLHLSALVDELRELLQDAKRAMTELHQAAIPDESTEGVTAIIPPAAFRKFVDAHAMLCFCLHQRGHNPEQGQQAAPKFATGGVVPPGNFWLVGESAPELELLKK